MKVDRGRGHKSLKKTTLHILLPSPLVRLHFCTIFPQKHDFRRCKAAANSSGRINPSCGQFLQTPFFVQQVDVKDPVFRERTLIQFRFFSTLQLNSYLLGTTGAQSRCHVEQGLIILALTMGNGYMQSDVRTGSYLYHVYKSTNNSVFIREIVIRVVFAGV